MKKTSPEPRDLLDSTLTPNYTTSYSKIQKWTIVKLLVTTPPEIIPYYRLNYSIWSLSDNKESFR
jgi:hypothetical protein